MTTQNERRMQSRKRPVSLVYVELPPANGGMMRDLSEQGFSLRAMMPLRPSEKVPFSFNLDSNARIDGDAIVVRLEDGGHVAALEFAGLSAHSRDQIRRWLDKYDESSAKESTKPAVPPAANSTFEELRTEIRATEGRPKTPPVQLPIVKPVEPVSAPAAELSGHEPPPLLKLSSVRPDAAPKILVKAPPPPEKVETAVKPAAPSSVQLQPLRQPEHGMAPVTDAPPLVDAEPMLRPSSPPSPVAQPRELPPALEPLSSLEGEADEANPSWMETFTLTRAIGIMLLLTVIAGSFVYHREIGHALVWLGQKIAGDEISESKQPANSPSTAPLASAPITTEAAPNSNTEAATNATAPTASAADSSSAKISESSGVSQAAQPPQVNEPKNSSLVPLTQVTRQPASTGSSPATADGGQQDYQRAQAILKAPNRSAELPEAIRLLWSAVEKGNVGAEITLAELYHVGRGVSKNCAQSKILLATAARKGSPDAQRRLEALQREGCEE